MNHRLYALIATLAIISTPALGAGTARDMANALSTINVPSLNSLKAQVNALVNRTENIIQYLKAGNTQAAANQLAQDLQPLTNIVHNNLGSIEAAFKQAASIVPQSALNDISTGISALKDELTTLVEHANLSGAASNIQATLQSLITTGNKSKLINYFTNVKSSLSDVASQLAEINTNTLQAILAKAQQGLSTGVFDLQTDLPKLKEGLMMIRSKLAPAITTLLQTVSTNTAHISALIKNNAQQAGQYVIARIPQAVHDALENISQESIMLRNNIQKLNTQITQRISAVRQQLGL